MPHNITPVILCGGFGRRLRPLSTSSCPKPFLKIGRGPSMLQKTLLRVQSLSAPILVLNVNLRDRALLHIKTISIHPRRMIFEPVGRNTAPALATAALEQENENDLMLVLPSDHDIRNPALLLNALRRAAPLAESGWIIAFGIRPTRAETGFGYIRRGGVVADGIFRIDRFLEKPPRSIAKTLVRSGTCDWNSGIFLLSAKTARNELACFEPDLLSHVQTSLLSAHREIHDGTAHIYPADSFSAAPKLSIDVVVMERSDKTLVMPLNLDWSDLGTWPAFLSRLIPRRNAA